VEVCCLLKAIEHSLRHRSRKPFVSFGKISDYVPQRLAPKGPDATASTVEVGEQRLSHTETARTDSGKVVRPLFDTFIRREDAKSSSLPGPATRATTREAEEEQSEEQQPEEEEPEDEWFGEEWSEEEWSEGEGSEEERPEEERPEEERPEEERPEEERPEEERPEEERPEEERPEEERPEGEQPEEDQPLLTCPSRTSSGKVGRLPFNVVVRGEDAITHSSTPWRHDSLHIQTLRSARATIDGVVTEDAKLSSLPEPASPNADAETEDNLGLGDATNRTDTYDPGLPNKTDHDDDVSVKSSGEGSVFSMASIASSATDLSKGSGFSAVQIATATRDVLSILRDDGVLYPLYTAAIQSVVVLQNFVNIFRRMLKAFADRLKDEARDRLDFLAALLVGLKAQEISEAIFERYQLGKAPTLDTEEGRETTTLDKDVRESSGKVEQEERNVDDTIFGELSKIREFLVQSAAFKLLRADLQSFTSSKQPSIERQVGVAVRSIVSTVEYDCLGLLEDEWELPLLRLHLHALDMLGKDRFVVEYSKLLHHYYGESDTIAGGNMAGSKKRNLDAQLITRWKPVASNILLHLKTADATKLYWKDGDPKARVKAHDSLVSWYTERDNYREEEYDVTPLHLLSRDLAFSTLRRPLQELLSQIPGYRIELSPMNDMSFVNRTKAFLEDYTMTEWDWWPIAPRVPDVAPGEWRLQWKVCFFFFKGC